MDCNDNRMHGEVFNGGSMNAKERVEKIYYGIATHRCLEEELSAIAAQIEEAEREAVADSNRQSAYCEMVRGIGFKEGFHAGAVAMREKAANLTVQSKSSEEISREYERGLANDYDRGLFDMAEALERKIRAIDPKELK